MLNPKNRFYPVVLVVCYSVLGLCMPAAVTQFSMLVDTMAATLQVGSQTVLLADSVRAVCLVAAMFLSGVVYNKLGLKKTLVLGLFFQIAPQFLIPLALQVQSLPFFYLAKSMQGLNAVAFPLYLSTITAWVPSRNRGLAIAVFNGSFTAGGGVGAWLSGKIIPAFGATAAFYFVGIMCLVFAVPAILVTKTPPGMQAGNKHKQLQEESGGYRRILARHSTWLLVISMLACTWVMQAVTVDMSLYAVDTGYTYGQTGDLMLLVSVATVVFSILGGSASDKVAMGAQNKVRARCFTLVGGYALTAVAALLLPKLAAAGFAGITAGAVCMMAGVAWAQGGFWAIPGDIYSASDNVFATSICSGASNIVNPVAPMVVGVLLGTRGYWGAAWATCAAISALSVAGALGLTLQKQSGRQKARQKTA